MIFSLKLNKLFIIAQRLRVCMEKSWHWSSPGTPNFGTGEGLLEHHPWNFGDRSHAFDFGWSATKSPPQCDQSFFPIRFSWLWWSRSLSVRRDRTLNRAWLCSEIELQAELNAPTFNARTRAIWVLAFSRFSAESAKEKLIIGPRSEMRLRQTKPRN